MQIDQTKPHANSEIQMTKAIKHDSNNRHSCKKLCNSNAMTSFIPTTEYELPSMGPLTNLIPNAYLINHRRSEHESTAPYKGNDMWQ